MKNHEKDPVELRGLPDVITPKEAAVVLRLSLNATYQALARGEIPHVRLGSKYLIPRAALIELLSAPPAGAIKPPAMGGDRHAKGSGGA